MRVSKSNKRVLFITGSPRSGTTLIARLLGQFEDVDSFSQPLPLLLVEAKRKFLERTGHPAAGGPYPLSDQQFENSYPISDFVDFLQQHPLSTAEIQKALDSMDNYSGQYFRTSAAKRHATAWRDDGFVGLVDQFFHTFGSGAPIAAWKEVYAEEYIHSLLESGGRVILMLRDPRDVAASLNLGNSQHAGMPRPWLWIARQWRKSAAYALRFAADTRVKICKYEDVVRDPEAALADWREFLGPGPSPAWRRGTPLQDSSGAAWQSNSSFQHQEGVSEDSVGLHRKVLPEPMLHLLEALCFAEMHALGYTPTIDQEQLEHVLQVTPDEVPERIALSALAWSSSRRAEELERWYWLTSHRPNYRDNAFIFEQSYTELRRALAQ